MAALSIGEWSRLLSPQPTLQAWSLLSVSKLLSIGDHSGDWGWMVAAVTLMIAESQTQGELSRAHCGSWSYMELGKDKLGVHCHIWKPTYP